MDFKRGLDEWPTFTELILYGLQWLAISVPGVVIIGMLVGQMHFGEASEVILYLQKLFFITAVTLGVQVLLGHRLPLVLGPAAVLLVGVVSSQGHELNTIYTSIMIGGAVLSLLSLLGLFPLVQRLFTPRVVALVLLLIAFTLAPSIMRLLCDVRSGIPPLFSLLFAMSLLVLLFLMHRVMRGVWKATLIVVAMAAGSLAHALIFHPAPKTVVESSLPFISGFWHNLTVQPTLDPGVLISFLCCYLALAINDLGSIKSMGEILKPPHMESRISRGISITGAANILAGYLGVLGPVNFSLSPGVVMASGCASRYALLPTAFVLLLLSFSPVSLYLLTAIPGVVIGCVLLYILCAQVAAGLMVAFDTPGGFLFQDGLILGFPLLLGTIIAFLPEPVLLSFPSTLRPILGNGFVVGVLAVLLLEHLVLPRKSGS